MTRPKQLAVFSLVFVWQLQAVINGELPSKKYAAVGSIRADDSLHSFCTATLLSEEWIILAGHCREGGSEEDPFLYEARQLSFQIGIDSKNPEQSVKLASWLQPEIPSPAGDDANIELDIAVAKLSKPILKVKPIPISIAPLDLKASYEFLGFGYTESLGWGSPHGQKLKASYRIASIKGAAFLDIFKSPENFARYLRLAHPGEEELVDKHIHNSQLIDNYQVLAWDDRNRRNGDFSQRPEGGWVNTCHGDSGGPFLKTQDDELRIVGVIQGGFNGASEACLQIGSRVGVFGPLLKQFFVENKVPFLTD